MKQVEAKHSEAQREIAEAVETAQEVAAYEPEEDETVTASVIKKALKELIDDLKGERRWIRTKGTHKHSKRKRGSLTALEKRIKESKAEAQ